MPTSCFEYCVLGHDDHDVHLIPQHMYMQLPFAGTMPRKYTKKTDRVRTPLDVLTRANEAVAQGGNYTRVAKEFSIERMKLKHFIRKEKLQGPATSAGYE